jgi:hypothetical protein
MDAWGPKTRFKSRPLYQAENRCCGVVTACTTRRKRHGQTGNQLVKGLMHNPQIRQDKYPSRPSQPVSPRFFFTGNWRKHWLFSATKSSWWSLLRVGSRSSFAAEDLATLNFAGVSCLPSNTVLLILTCGTGAADEASPISRLLKNYCASARVELPNNFLRVAAPAESSVGAVVTR